MSIVTYQESTGEQALRISCPCCNVTKGIAAQLYAEIKQQLIDEDRDRLDAGIASGRYEVALVLPPSFEWKPWEWGGSIRCKRARGHHHLVHLVQLAPVKGEKLPTQERIVFQWIPDDMPAFWALQVYDRQEPDPARRHFGFVYCSADAPHARRLDLTLTPEGRLIMAIAAIGPVDSWLFQWAGHQDLFNGIDFPPLRSKKKVASAKGKGTWTALWSRFLAAVGGQRLGFVPVLGSEGKELVHVHHGDERVWHHCRGNLIGLRARPHLRLSGVMKSIQKGASQKGWKISNGAPMGPHVRPIQVVRAMRSTDPFGLELDINTAASIANYAMELVHQTKGAAGIPNHYLKLAIASQLLPPVYQRQLELEQRRRSRKPSNP